jgi:hypothetical protein
MNIGNTSSPTDLAKNLYVSQFIMATAEVALLGHQEV